jgi:hypothetical protein
MAVDPITGALKIVDSGVQVISGGQENRKERIKQQTEAIKALAGITGSRAVVQAEQEKAKGKTKMILAISVGVLLLGVVTAFVITTMKKK